MPYQERLGNIRPQGGAAQAYYHNVRVKIDNGLVGAGGLAMEDWARRRNPMPVKKILEETREPIDDTEGYVRGVVYTSDKYIEYGWFKESTENILVMVRGDTPFGRNLYSGISREALSNLVFAKGLGYYILPGDYSEKDLNKLTRAMGQGKFPYDFDKHYEAADSFNLFKDAQKVLNEVEYPLSKELKYTFGLEFETSMGYIPQEICYRDGLIPLRDGSITGIEYSTVVLEGNRGLNLLKQQVSTLKEYTTFNKECALHIHFGGYPVDPVSIMALYGLWYAVERDLESNLYVPSDTFRTSKYKANGKDYCNKLTGKNSFEQLFRSLTGQRYFGSLVQPHPADVEKRAKWNIKSRYFGLNLVNMVCYKGPKTVEFRFLRPTFNYRVITLWMYVLNAVLRAAERIANEWREEHCNNTEDMTSYILSRCYDGIKDLLARAYDAETFNKLSKELDLLQNATEQQEANGDHCGRDTFFIDNLLHDD